jgi:hypothetical protein
MHFIETIFHVAPDHGSGTLEFAIVLAVLFSAATLLALRMRQLRRRASREAPNVSSHLLRSSAGARR